MRWLANPLFGSYRYTVLIAEYAKHASLVVYIMKGFFIFLLICALVVGGYFAYDPYIKPLLKGDEASMTDGSLIRNGGKEESPSGEAGKPSQGKAPQKPSSGMAKATKKEKKPEPKKSELDLLLEKKYPIPDVLPLEQIVDGWKNVPARAFPAEVTSSETIPFQLVVNGQAIGSSNVAPGTPLKPLRLEGAMLTIGNPANPGMNAAVPVDKTDFKQRITARYNQFVEKVTTDAQQKRDRVRKIVEADPSKMALLTGQPAKTTSPDDPRIGLVKDSLRNGEAASVTLEEATSFAWNGSERIGGAFAGTYDTVTVHFEVATIFGRFPVDYKALIQGNKVVGWIDPITEEKI